MAILTKLEFTIDGYSIKISKPPHGSPDWLYFRIEVNGKDFGSMEWRGSTVDGWYIDECPLTIEDVQDVILPKLLLHIKSKKPTIYFREQLNTERGFNITFAEYVGSEDY